MPSRIFVLHMPLPRFIRISEGRLFNCEFLWVPNFGDKYWISSNGGEHIETVYMIYYIYIYSIIFYNYPESTRLHTTEQNVNMWIYQLNNNY